MSTYWNILIPLLLLLCLLALSTVDAKDTGLASDFGSLMRSNETDELDSIIGGDVVSKGQHRYMVFLESDPKLVGCGGSLLDDRHVLTAAHCLVNPDTGVLDNKVEVYLNVYTVEPMDSTAIRRTVLKKNFKIHQKYNYRAPTKGYDIAILKLNPPISSAVMGKLDTIRLGDDNDLDRIQTLVLGWGKVDHDVSKGSLNFSPKLKQTKLKVLSKGECESQWGSNYTHSIQLCTAPANTQVSVGDSGGPLLWQKYEKIPGTSQFNWDKIFGYQAGIVSFSTGGIFGKIVRTRMEDRAGRQGDGNGALPDIPQWSSATRSDSSLEQGSVFTRVQAFVNNGWIKANMV